VYIGHQEIGLASGDQVGVWPVAKVVPAATNVSSGNQTL
jgi:hypothetical protein